MSLNDPMVIHELRSPSAVQPPSSGDSQGSVTCPQSPQSETIYWPDVQELRSKYIPNKLDTEASHSWKGADSGTLLNNMQECCTNRCHSCSHSYNNLSDIHKALTDCPTSQPGPVDKDSGGMVRDWPQPWSKPRLQPLLCRWSSLDHMLGSLPLQEVQNLQEPVRTCYTASQLSLTATETGKLQEGDNLLREGLDCPMKSAALSLGKISESNLVKNLREKFQSLSTS